jgi:cytochrome o ubiquinol oxidase subunit 3
MSQAVASETLKQAQDSKANFGFWLYLMTDCVLFASLFAVFAVLRHSTFGGPTGAQLFSLPYVLAETLILLTSSFICGLSMVFAQQRLHRAMLIGLGFTFLLGISFLLMEINEFHHLAAEGNSWRRSGFLSAYFVLVGTHGLHITAGLLWLGVLRVKIWRQGLTANNMRKLTMFSLFWHFLDIIWIFIFTIVYLMGAIPV